MAVNCGDPIGVLAPGYVVLRRLDCVLESKKDDVIKAYEEFKDELPDMHCVVGCLKQWAYRGYILLAFLVAVP